MENEIKLGNRVQTVSLKEKDISNIAIFGTECGTKMTLTQQVIEEMIQKFELDVIVFDRQRKMRNLLVKTEGVCYLTNVYPIENFTMNVMKVPEGINPYMWFQMTSTLFGEMYRLNQLEVQLLLEAFLMANEKSEQNNVVAGIEDVDFALEDEYRRKTDSEFYALYSPANLHNSFVKVKHLVGEWKNPSSNYEHLLFGEEPLDWKEFTRRGRKILIELEDLPLKYEIFIQKFLIQFLYMKAREENEERKLMVVLKNTKNILFEINKEIELNYQNNIEDIFEDAPRFGMYFMIEKQKKEQLPKEIEINFPLQFEVVNMPNEKVEIVFENKFEKERITLQKQNPYQMEQGKLIPFVTTAMIEKNAKEIDEELVKMNLELELEEF